MWQQAVRKFRYRLEEVEAVVSQGGRRGELNVAVLSVREVRLVQVRTMVIIIVAQRSEPTYDMV